MKIKDFLIKVLNGTAIGIVVALIPNAVLGAILKQYASNPIVAKLLFALVVMQALVSVIIGILVGLQFGFDGMKSTIIGAAAFIASGVVKPISIEGGSTYYHMAGTGDLINVMIFAGVAAYLTLILKDKLGSVKIILQPILIGAGVGFIGLLCLPYVSMITKAIGDIIINFTTLQPLLMSILITISFAIIIVSPISTVAIGMAVGLSGLSSGAANMGVTTTAIVLVIGSYAARNKLGVTLAVLLGGMKMMMPNVFRNVIIYVPIIITAIAGAIGVRYLGILGTPQSAGFGIVGLVGPLKAYEMFVDANVSAALLRVVTAYFIIPVSAGLISHILCTKVLKLYSPEVFKFEN